MEDLEKTISFNINNSNELINNQELRKYVNFKLNSDHFSKNDLEKIDEIILDGKDIVGNYNMVFFDEIDLFPNLKSISIRNVRVSNDDMDKLKNIKEIEFINCELEGFEKLIGLKCLKLINTEVDNFNSIKELSELNELHLINVNVDDFNILKEYKNLNKLVIKNVEDFSLSKINFYLPIDYLSVEKINSINLDVLSQYDRLKTLSVDRRESRGFKDDLEKLINNGINILVNDEYEY